jgi:mRNA-degrading endonuclease RelE of RelBE toxin-antitoxin system
MDRLSVYETPIFLKHVNNVWDDKEREAFIDWIAQNPQSGVVIKNSDGIRKVRWGASGKGKSGGARIIYWNDYDTGEISLLIVYPKSKLDNLTGEQLRKIREKLRHG